MTIPKKTLKKLNDYIADLISSFEEDLENSKIDKKNGPRMKRELTSTLSKLMTILENLNKHDTKEETASYNDLCDEDKHILENFIKETK